MDGGDGDAPDRGGPGLLRVLLLPLGGLAAFTLVASQLTEGVLEAGDLAAHDPSVAEAAVAARGTVATGLAQYVTLLGSEVSIGLLTLVLLTVLAVRRRWAAFAMLLGTMAISAAITLGMKQAVARARPPTDLMLAPADLTYSFPSGHTLNSTVLFGLLAGLVVARARTWGARSAAVLGWVAASVAVGLSRVYLGYHWMTDVLAGWSIALALLSAAVAVALVWRPAFLRLAPRSSRSPDVIV